MTCLSKLTKLITKGIEDGSASSCRTEYDFKTTAGRDDERAVLIVKGIAVSVWADRLRLSGVIGRFAGARGGIFASAAVLRVMPFRAGGVTWIE